MLEEKRTGVNRNDGEIVCLDILVPKFHLLRKIGRAIDWRKIYPIVEHKYSKIGRPSVDPVVLVKMVMLNCQHIQKEIHIRFGNFLNRILKVFYEAF